MSVFEIALPVITTASAVGALAIAIRSHRLARSLQHLEHARDTVEAEQQRRRYAEQVSAWVAAADGAFHVVIDNASSAPIWDVTGRVKGFGKTQLLSTQRQMPPGRYAITRDVSREFAWSLPALIHEVGSLQPLTASRKHSILELTFRDSLGQHWRRTADGTLESHPTPGAPARAPLMSR